MLMTLKQGMAGDLVKVAQYLTGYSEMNKASGDFNSNFANYIGEWQTKNGLEVDKVIGPNTWKKIAKTLPTCSTSKNRESGYTCAIQILLGGGIKVDGEYGTKTKNAVAAYQEANGLEADGKCGIKTWTCFITGKGGDIKPGEKTINKCVHYLQWDSKWKNKKYSTHTSKQTIGNSGCGPTSMAQIMATWIDPKITPVEMCDLAVKNGFRTYDSGTSGGFFKFVFKMYEGFEKFLETRNMATIKSALEDGALVVVNVNGNDSHFWTTGGHYITAIGFDSNGYIYANDPNKKECPRKQKEDKFKSCLKNAWIFWPKKLDKTNTGGGDDTEKKTQETSQAVLKTKKPRGKEIVDISKWQGNIDFKALGKKVAFIIARGSCGSDKDVKIDEYAKAMNDNGIFFGVYCYSYAGDTAKAKEEAKNLVKYTKKYEPLFYVLDAEESKLTKESIEAFAKELKNQGARKIGCYVAGNELYKKYQFESVRSLFDFIWIPRYGSNDGTIAGSKKPNYKCDLWQYTSRGKIDGIKGNADMNIITGDGHDLEWFLS